ncbi:hypothetical protein GCM10020254_04030 [Streptomyces goshikiensis]
MEDAPMTSENVTEAESREPSEPQPSKSVDDRLIDELVSRAQAEGLQLTGEGGLLQQLTKRLLESALEGEITDHLGYDKHDPAGKNGGNSRNGTRAKTVLTDIGPVEISVPRDRGRILRAEDRQEASEAPDRCGRDGHLPLREGPDHRRGPGSPRGGLWHRGLPPDDLHNHRQGPRGHGRMAEPPPWTPSIRWSSSTPST